MALALLAAACGAYAKGGPEEQKRGDWEECYEEIQDSPAVKWDGCEIERRHIKDLDPDDPDPDGPTGCRYKRGSSNWCRLRIDCPRLVCDRNYNCHTVMERRAGSFKLSEVDELEWCAADDKPFYLRIGGCPYTPREAAEQTR